MKYRWITLLILAWATVSGAAEFDRSDLNNDGVVDVADLDFFSEIYFAKHMSRDEWCTFLNSSIQNEKYFRQVTSDNFSRYLALIDVASQTYDCISTTSMLALAEKSSGLGKSDMNGDGVVDLDDLIVFSMNYLEANWQNVDWCVFHGAVVAGAEFNGRSTSYYLKHFGALLDFVNTYYNCGGTEPPPNNLALENVPKFVARIADATATLGKYYITDPRVGSVFIYDNPLMTLSGEIKGLNKPLGIAVDSFGRVLVGNDGRDNIEVYDSATGDLVAVFGQGLVEMPTAITIDAGGYIYVTDSRKYHVQVFDSAYNPVRTIGGPGAGEDRLKFPMDTEIIVTGGAPGIYVADQGNNRVQVYDFNGDWLRSITYSGVEPDGCNWFTGVCTIPGVPPFTRLQALAKDSLGRLHVLDSFAASALIFDPADGTHIISYGGYGTTAGKFRVPMDVSISAADMATVTTGDGDRIEIIDIVALPQ